MTPRPCPFCGSSEVAVTTPPFPENIAGIGADRWVCPDCVACGPVGKSLDECTKLWNTRATDALVEAVGAYRRVHRLSPEDIGYNLATEEINRARITLFAALAKLQESSDGLAND